MRHLQQKRAARRQWLLGTPGWAATIPAAVTTPTAPSAVRRWVATPAKKLALRPTPTRSMQMLTTTPSIEPTTLLPTRTLARAPAETKMATGLG